jgi:hypothetical protein
VLIDCPHAYTFDSINSGSGADSGISRPVFVIAGGRATRAYASALATLLRAPLLTAHKAKGGPDALCEGRFFGAVVVPNPAELEDPLRTQVKHCCTRLRFASSNGACHVGVHRFIGVVLCVSQRPFAGALWC